MDTSSSGWVEVQQWLQKATNAVEMLAGDKEQGKAVLQQLRVSPRSLMGMLALETGVLFTDVFLGGDRRFASVLPEHALAWMGTSYCIPYRG